jgi:hypothetical protein
VSICLRKSFTPHRWLSSMQGNFLAFDAKDGKMLLKKNLGDPIGGGIVFWPTDKTAQPSKRCCVKLHSGIDVLCGTASGRCVSRIGRRFQRASTADERDAGVAALAQHDRFSQRFIHDCRCMPANQKIRPRAAGCV